MANATALRVGGTGYSTLLDSCLRGDLKEVKGLRGITGIDINAPLNELGDTLLIAASSVGHMELVEYLVDVAGANVNCCRALGVALISE